MRDKLSKKLVRWSYSNLIGSLVLSTAGIPRSSRKIRVFYGGARSGNVGGTLVKVKRLREKFPEHLFSYNLVYMLSNSPYMPAWAIRLLIQRKIPLVHNQDGVFYPAWYGGDWKGQNRRMAISFHQADHVFFQSRFCRDAATRFLGERTGSSEILYNAVDTQFFSTRDNPADGDEGRFTFLTTGKFTWHQGYKIISAISGIAYARKKGLDCRLNVAGLVDQKIRANAEALAEELGIGKQIFFTGPYTQEEAPEIYCSADAYITTKYNDNCPNAVLEALSCGLPVLYSASGGVPELVGNEAGIGIPCPLDWEKAYVPSAAEVGEGMLAIAGKREEFSKAARNRATEHFDIRTWMKRHTEVFTLLLEGGHS